MTEQQIKSIFHKNYKFDNWKPLYENIFPKVEFFTQPQNIIDRSGKAIEILHRGTVLLSDNKKLAILEAKLKKEVHISKNRVELRNIAAEYIDQYTNHGILIVYYSEDETQKDYRFSFITKKTEYTNEGEFVNTQTHPKRFTYVLGENQSCTTAAKRFLTLYEKKKTLKLEISDVEDAYSVETLTKEFYKKYYFFFINFAYYIIRNQYSNTVFNIPTLTDLFEIKKCVELDKKQKETVLLPDNKPIRDFVKRLLGRIVFLHFIQKKGWLGCPAFPILGGKGGEWLNGDKNFMQNLFLNFKNKQNFHSQCLTELFFNTLNRDRVANNDIFETTKTRVPYLNGGLFENDLLGTDKIDFPETYFNELFDFFEQYNFTIDENSPDEHEVGIDPEMLGHIFENLLEENKDKGAYYTPKEIVQYMCQESLIQYLTTNFDKVSNFVKVEDDINNFIRNQIPSLALMQKDNAVKLNNLLSDIKICDPAIGSGAFPIGLLQEIYKAKLFIYPFTKPTKPFNPADVKKKIIENSIYGVDLDKGAVDIARLRFWLALVVDEEIPQPLPNLDYKIMQGNSLLESFEGIDLSKVGKSGPDLKIIEPERDLFGNITENQMKMTYTNSETTKYIQQLIHDYFAEKFALKKTEIKKEINQYVHNHIDFNLNISQEQLNRFIIEAESNQNELNNQKKNNSQNLKIKNLKLIEKYKTDLKNLDTIRTKLHQLQNSIEKPYFLWHLYFKDVFDEGGFDIVIGNPPYIQLQKYGGTLANLYEKEGFETFERSGDIYELFYEKGFMILKQNGISTFITSNKWMRAGYGEKLRKFFIDKSNPLKLIDFAGYQVFDNATVDTNIILVQKNNHKKENSNFLGCFINKEYTKQIKLETYFEKNKIILKNLNSETWTVSDNKTQLIKQKIEKEGTPLKDWDINIYYGIKTGLNEAFLIDENTKNELIKKDEKNSKIIKPILRGRNLKKYDYNFANTWLINSHNGLKSKNIKPINLIKDYSEIYNYLCQFLPEIEKRQDKGEHWSNLRNCAYLNEFEKEKIAWASVGETYFTLVPENMLLLDTNYFCVFNTKKINRYILGLLNSKLLIWYLNQLDTAIGSVVYRHYKYNFEQIPIPKLPLNEQKPFEILVEYILYIKDFAPKEAVMSSYFEQIINGCVYELYFEESLKAHNKDILQFLQDLQPLTFSNWQLATTEELTSNSQQLKALFNKLYHPEHPVRQRLYYMDSVSEVRIIEGKEVH